MVLTINRMGAYRVNLVGTLLLATAVVVLTVNPVSAQAHYRHRGPFVIQDSLVTPGEIRTLDAGDVCHRSTKTIRNVTLIMHKWVFAKYGVSYANRGSYEDDHLIPLELGGANSNSNRWPQPLPEAYSKDSVENWLHRQVCSGKMRLFEAQKLILDWPIAYAKMKQGRN